MKTVISGALFFISLLLGAECLSDAECRFTRKCVDKLCYFPEEIEKKQTASTMLTDFFKQSIRGYAESFFLMKNEYPLFFNEENGYEIYRSTLIGDVALQYFSGAESIVSVIPGSVEIVKDFDGRTYFSHVNSVIFFNGKTGKKSWNIGRIVYVNGRWSVVEIYSILEMKGVANDKK